MAQVSYGTITITDTNDIERIYIVYAKSTTNTVAPDAAVSTWTESIDSAPGSGSYIWQRTVVKKSGVSELSYGNPICVTGPRGADGADGVSGRGIDSIVTSYCNYGEGTPAESSGRWQSTIPTYDSDYPNYWVKTVTTYTSGTPNTSTLIYKDNGITDAMATAADAVARVEAVEADIEDALDQVATATEATALLAGHFIYKDSTSESGLTPPSANVVQTVVIEGDPEDPESENIDVTDDPAQWGYNVHIGSNGIKLRKDESVLSEWLDQSLNFYLPGLTEIGTQVTTDGMFVNHGGITNKRNEYFLTSDDHIDTHKTYYTLNEETGEYEVVVSPNVEDITTYYEYGFNENLKLYLSTEDYGSSLTINGFDSKSWRQVIGKNFGVTNEGYLYCNGANISGRFEIIAGSNVYTKTEARARLTELETATGVDQWRSEYGQYILTTDAVPYEGTVYYQGIYDYYLTKDTVIDSNKTYYTKTPGTEDYEEVVSPDIANISIYYEYAPIGYTPIDLDVTDNPQELELYVLNELSSSLSDYVQTHIVVDETGLWLKSGEDDKYKIQLTNQGMTVYDGTNNVISAFGDNIEFSASKRQRIGGKDSYIEFNPTDDSLIINASQIRIGTNNVVNTIESLRSDYQNELAQVTTNLTTTTNELNQNIENLVSSNRAFREQLDGYIDIDPVMSIMRIGKKNNDETINSYIEINAYEPSDMRISINMDRTEVAYFNNERMYVPSAVVTNLYMQTKTGEGESVGTMGWLMRSNGHLSLKEIE